MKKSKKLFLIAAAFTVIVVLGAIFIPKAIKSSKKKSTAAQQNYVASKLIEIGDYGTGYSLALETDAFYPNKTSKELVMLASGFNGELDNGIEYGKYCLESTKDDVISSLCELFESTKNDPAASFDTYSARYYLSGELDESFRSELMSTLKSIQDSIKVKKSASTLRAMANMYASSTYGNISSTELQEIESDDSPVALRLRTVYAANYNDYDTAISTVEKLVEADDSFVNRALAANIVAHAANPIVESGSRLEKRIEQKSELEAKLSEELLKLNADYSDLTYLKGENKKINELSDQLDSVTNDIEYESVHRAINYIEETATASDKKSAAYPLERSYLYHKAGDNDTAKKLLLLMIGQLGQKNHENDSMSMIISSICESYRISTAFSDQKVIKNSWSHIANALGFRNNNYDGSDSFLSVFLEALDAAYRSVVVRSVDSSDFPTVRITVNVAEDIKDFMKSGKLSITDTDGEVKNIKVSSLSKETKTENITVMLAVDTSGSMNGSAIYDTKKAVESFVRGAASNVSIGLVQFDGGASLLAAPQTMHRNLLLELEQLEASGSTSIAAGLETSLETLKKVSGRRVIILLSDGADSNTERINAALDEINREGVTVYTIGVEGSDASCLTHIATTCGGKYISAASTSMLAEIYSDLGSFMVNDYLIEYRAVEKLDEYDRYFEIEINDANASANGKYSVGVKAEDIEDDNDINYYGMFRQIGGQ